MPNFKFVSLNARFIWIPTALCCITLIIENPNIDYVEVIAIMYKVPLVLYVSPISVMQDATSLSSSPMRRCSSVDYFFTVICGTHCVILALVLCMSWLCYACCGTHSAPGFTYSSLQDKSKCACIQRTLEASRASRAGRTNSSAPYRHRRIRDHVVTGYVVLSSCVLLFYFRRFWGQLVSILGNCMGLLFHCRFYEAMMLLASYSSLQSLHVILRIHVVCFC